eukprot:2511848-Karenia_brevis.AAC.1
MAQRALEYSISSDNERSRSHSASKEENDGGEKEDDHFQECDDDEIDQENPLSKGRRWNHGKRNRFSNVKGVKKTGARLKRSKSDSSSSSNSTKA